ncbi:MAG: alkyl hydroperoxide reductase [Hyphomonas sp.]|uniref:redoxin domain-containing protein n=1 Tax=Hyphomonas sp. TaxID=87 RepID=UPI001DB24C91|nr:redoxin domain-containing protein [Hyphomonas sp.]MBA4228554.1 alkyl hydroperoxide reductase [Hyphomonas sp.]
MVALRMAPEWDITTWLNTDVPISLASLRGRPIVAAGFQMLCPGCVAETIPQLNRIHRLFPADQLAVIGLHSVFEHHEAMREPSLRAFLHEYGVRFPVGIDRHVTGDPIPTTMRTYGFQGTPTLLLIDADGRLRRQHFGHIPDLQLGAEIMALMRDAALKSVSAADVPDDHGPRCEIGATSC